MFRNCKWGIVFFVISIVGCTTANDVKKETEKIHDELLQSWNNTMKKLDRNGVSNKSFGKIGLLKKEAEQMQKKAEEIGAFSGGKALYNALMAEINYAIGTCNQFLSIEKNNATLLEFDMDDWLYRAKNGMDKYEDDFLLEFETYNQKVGTAF